MPRYFLEVCYDGSRYAGFQIQENAVTIQSEVSKAFQLIHRQPVALTGSSRTDAGVHALQNYFQFDAEYPIHPQAIYKMNAVLPADIAVKSIREVEAGRHCRFDATFREYEYKLHTFKNPFLQHRSWYFPFTIDLERLNECAAMLLAQTDYFPFSKTNSQVKTHQCRVFNSQWHRHNNEVIYSISANRFLRGMVRMLVATMLKVGRGSMTMQEFEDLFGSSTRTTYAAPACGLYLKSVSFPF